ncbi:MAG: threonine dehydratase [Alphaproteobacteria bacterium]|nr:threonine dehydratase [Alphaproteobacteria bacterium]
MFSHDELTAAAELVHGVMTPTPQIAWPLLAQRLGAEVWVKHENHTPIGAFKVRGGLVHLDRLKRERPDLPGIVSATRGNHGQSIGLAARRLGLKATIVVPEGNSIEKNRAMRALGVELIEAGHDFEASRATAARIGDERGYVMVPPFVPDLMLGVATYALEFLGTVGDLDTVYVPIGMGSGICGMIRTRDLLGLKTEIVGVVAEGAPAYALSFSAGKPIATNQAVTMADGLACRNPDAAAVEIINKGAARIVTVSDEEIARAMRVYYADTHNLAEGAGAAPLAALMQEQAAMRGKKLGVILSGGNIDRDLYLSILGAADEAR